jgi:hypothetical protein
MAKLNKSQTDRFAKDCAERCADVQAISTSQLAAMDYSGKRALAMSLAQTAVEITDLSGSAYPGAFLHAYAEAVEAVWQDKLRRLRIAREQWARVSGGMRGSDACRKLVELLEAMHIRGARISENSVEIERGNRLGGRLYFRFERNWDVDSPVENPDDASQKAGHYAFTVQISTTGSTWSLADMAVLNKINAELTDIGNELVSTVNGWRVVWTYGIPEQAPVAVQA